MRLVTRRIDSPFRRRRMRIRFSEKINSPRSIRLLRELNGWAKGENVYNFLRGDQRPLFNAGRQSYCNINPAFQLTLDKTFGRDFDYDLSLLNNDKTCAPMRLVLKYFLASSLLDAITDFSKYNSNNTAPT